MYFSYLLFSASWIPKGSYIKSPSSSCSSKLLYSANLKKPGYVSFTYSIATSETMFHVQVSSKG